MSIRSRGSRWRSSEIASKGHRSTQRLDVRGEPEQALAVHAARVAANLYPAQRPLVHGDVLVDADNLRE